METKPNDLDFASAAEALAWLVDMGADEIVAEQPLDRFADSLVQTPAKAVAPAPAQPTKPAPPTPAPLADASGLATLADITQALNFIENHPLRKAASNLCFFEGPERADILIIADHPRKEEDRAGLVFADKARLLLTAMLGAIGLKFEAVALMNLLPWRVLGGAAPRPGDIAPVLPFARRAVELVQPRLILGFSAIPGHYLAGADPSFPRQRGKWLEVGGIPLLTTFHPDELLKHPGQKRLAWRDLQAFQERLP